MLTPDFNNLVIHSDASITDMVAFHAALRDIECSQAGILYPAIHTYKEVHLGGGAIFPAIAFVNGWSLQFPAGNWYVTGGNLAAIINPVANCYVMQTQSAAFAVTSSAGGGGGLTAEQDALLSAAAAQATLARKLQSNKAVISGDGLSVSIYDDDGSTLLHTFTVSADKNTRTPA
jgi:hypothetical protein